MRERKKIIFPEESIIVWKRILICPENTGQPLESMDRNFRDPLTETER